MNINNQKYSTIETMLLNMAPILASMGAGYDIRLSNICAIHPKLLAER